MTAYETTGRTEIGLRRASGSFVKLRATPDELSITTPIGSIALTPREVVGFEPLPQLFRHGGFEIVHTRDDRRVRFWCRDADVVRERIAAAGFVPRGTPGGGPDPARFAERADEARRDAGRRWKIGALIAVVVVALIGAIGFGLWYGFRHSDVYVTSWETVRNDPRVIAITGTPMESGMPSGNIEVNNGEGSAEIRYDVSGPKGRGGVEADGTKADGAWRIDRLVFRPDMGGTAPIELTPRRP